MTTEEYISSHLNDDVHALALRPGDTDGVDLSLALTQIEGRQRARRKLPSWAANPGMLYPPHLSMEQCSSEVTARKKAEIAAARLAARPAAGETTLTDLTGGFGVDFACMAREFSRGVYVERQSHLCDIARHNFSALGLGNVEVVCADSEQYLDRMEHSTCIFADPARRDAHGSRTYSVRDCTPDVLAMKDKLLAKADFVMLKLSPMLDLKQTVRDFGRCVDSLIMTEAGGECKELLVVLSARDNLYYDVTFFDGTGPCTFSYSCWHDGAAHDYGITGDETGIPEGGIEARRASFADPGKWLRPIPEAERARQSEANSRRTGLLKAFLESSAAAADIPGGAPAAASRLPCLYIIEPSAAVMKAGCFAQVERECRFTPLSKNSHLFLTTPENPCRQWRTLRITAAATMNKRQLRVILSGVSRANITVRNFPLSAAELRRRLRLKDGGDTYLFATTLEDGTHVVIKGEKTGGQQGPASGGQPRRRQD